MFAGSSPITSPRRLQKHAKKVRVLCSAGITQPRRSYDPVRLPPWPLPSATLRTLPSPLTGLPRLPEPPFRRAVPTTPADRAGAPVDYFPAHAAFPKWQEGQHPHCHFRGLRRLHSVTARRIAQPPKVTFVTRLQPSQLPGQPLVSFRTYRQLSGWNPPPQVFRAFGAHCHLQTPVGCRNTKRHDHPALRSGSAR